MAIEEAQNFLILIIVIIKFAPYYVNLPFNDFLRKRPCTCRGGVKVSYGKTSPHGGAKAQHCIRRLRDGILALLKVKEYSLPDVDFARLSHIICSGIILAIDPSQRKQFIHELDKFIINRGLDNFEAEVLVAKFENWKTVARKKKLIIEDDTTKLKLSEELLTNLGHCLQKCDGVISYGLGGKFRNLEIKFNPDEVTGDDIRTFLNSCLKDTEYDLSKRRYFSDIITPIPSKKIVTLQLECFPGMIVHQNSVNLMQTFGIFLEIERSERVVVTTVTHGNVFDQNTYFQTHTTDMIWSLDENITLRPHLCTVYNGPVQSQPDSNEAQMAEDPSQDNDNEGESSTEGATSSQPDEPSQSQTDNNGSQMEVDSSLNYGNIQNVSTEGATSCQPEEGFIDICCIETTKPNWEKLTEERGGKCLTISNIEPKDVTQLMDRPIQKIGAATGQKFGKIKYPNYTFRAVLNGTAVWITDVIITEQDTSGLASFPVEQVAMEDTPNLSVETSPVGTGEDFLYPDAISQQGDSGSIITTLPQDPDQLSVDAVSVHFAGYRSHSEEFNKELSYSVSFRLGPAVQKLQDKMGVSLKFIKSCIPDYERRCRGDRYEFIANQ